MNHNLANSDRDITEEHGNDAGTSGLEPLKLIPAANQLKPQSPSQEDQKTRFNQNTQLIIDEIKQIIEEWDQMTVEALKTKLIAAA